MNEPRQKNIDPKEEEISILDLTLQLVKKAPVIIKTLFYFLLIGIIAAIITPSKYTATSIVVNEAIGLEDMNLSGGLSALRKFGINLGSPNEGLTLEAYPEIITSREVLLAVARDTFYFRDKDTTMCLVDYINLKDFFYYIKKFTIKLPYTVYRFFFPKKILLYPPIGEGKNDILFIRQEEYEAIKILREEYLSVESDIETGLITISVKTFDPNLSAEINAAILEKFRIKMQQIYDKKAGENLNFIRERFREAERDLRNAEEKVVRFLEKNSDPNTIALQTELERLNRNVSFKAEVYSELQTQLTQTQIELKRKEPVIRILERPSPPNEASGTGRLFIIIAILIVGIFFVMFMVMFELFTKNLKQDKENQSKIDEIRILISKIKLRENIPFIKRKINKFER